MSFRITVNEKASPIVSNAPSTTTGAMVIKASKGNAEPVKISKGDPTELIRLFGYPSASYPHVQEALWYNEDSDIWVSAPSGADSVKGGVLVTPTGTEPLTVGVANNDLFNFSTVDYKESIGTGDNATTNFSFVLSKTYVNTSISKVIVNGTEIDVTATDAEPEVLSGTGITSGTLTRGTKTLDITFDTAPILGATIEVIYQADYTDAYYVLFSKSSHVADEKVKTKHNSALTPNQFEFDFYISDNKKRDTLVDSYIGSIVPNTFNASGENIYLETLLEDNPYFDVKVNTETFTSFVDDTSLVSFDGGSRDATFTSTEIAEGWEFFQGASSYPVDIFMDVTGDGSVPAIFNTLRNTYQKYKRYILALPDNETASESIATKIGYSIDNRGLSFYSNWAYVKENYYRTKFWTPLISKVGIKHAEIIRGAFGGLAPAWLNENSLGGQLSVTIEKIRNSYTETDLQTLDSAGVNPIVNDLTYGVLITSHKTAQDPNVLTDFSYIAHSGSADYVISNVIKQILVQQIVKLNDADHRTQVQAKADTIVDPLLGRNIFIEAINKCDEENNNATVREKRQFVLQTVVKYTPTSEFIVFDYISTPQGVSVSEYIA